ncbi:MAG: TlpA family protein disulfide reductase [Deltaproteobacteria bacterium]|nr:TlpA family protein disulfide reductase [Deltaproteobacteria bacterium]
MIVIMRKVSFLLLCSMIFISAGNKLEEGMIVPKFFVKIYNENLSGFSVIRSDNLFDGKNKAVIVSFFASYCKPCKKEIFVLADFYKKYKNKGIMIIEISIDTEPEGIELFKKIVDETGIEMPCVIDPMGVMARRFGVSKLPTLFVFDRYGYVKKRFEGYTEENVNNFEKIVLGLIEEGAMDEDIKSLPNSDIKRKADQDLSGKNKKEK